MTAGSLLIVFCLAVGWWCMYGGGRTKGAVGRSVSVRGHTHGNAGGGTRMFIATHEGGHAVSARPLGGRVRSARMTDNSGLVKARFHADTTEKSVHQVVAFLYAGQLAVGSRNGAWADEAVVDDELKRLPRGDRERARRAAYADARRIVSGRTGEIQRYAAKLERKGKL